MSRIGEKIKETRDNLGWSQKQLAKKLGVAENFINEVEIGRKVLNEGLITRISKALGRDINDITMSFEEEVYKEEKQVREPSRDVRGGKPIKPEAVNEVWNDAFGSVLKNVPIYGYGLKDVIEKRQLPIVSNKIEGYAQDKVLFLQIQDDDMIGFRIGKGDLAFGHITHDIENNGICLVEYNNERKIRQIKKLDGSKVLLISNMGGVKTETVGIKELKILVKLDKVEIKL